MMTGLRLIRELAGLYALRPRRTAPLIRHPALVRAHRLRCLLWAAALGMIFSVIVVHPAAAQGLTLFDPIVNAASGQSQGWFNSILGLVRPTFLLLGTIEICWAAAIWAFERDSLNSLAIEIIKKFMFIGFFFALLQFAPQWIPTIVASFQQAGQAAAGVQQLSTDNILSQGLSVVTNIWSQTIIVIGPAIALDPEEIAGTANPLAYAGLVFATTIFVLTVIATIIIVIAYVVVAAQYFTLQIESFVLFAAGAIFLGLGSSSWTKDYVTRYLNYAINVGVRMLVLILILSITMNAVNNAGSGFTVGLGILTFNPSSLLQIMAAALIQAILAMKAPEMAGALLSGGSGLTAGGAFGSVASAVGNLRTAAALATGPAGAAAGAAGAVAGAATGGGRTSSLRDAVSVAPNMGGPQANRSGAAASLGGLGGGGVQPARISPTSPGVAIGGRGGANSVSASNGGGPGSLHSGLLQDRGSNLSLPGSGASGLQDSGGTNPPRPAVPGLSGTPVVSGHDNASSSNAPATPATSGGPDNPVSLAGLKENTDMQGMPPPAVTSSTFGQNPLPPPKTLSTGPAVTTGNTPPASLETQTAPQSQVSSLTSATRIDP